MAEIKLKRKKNIVKGGKKGSRFVSSRHPDPHQQIIGGELKGGHIIKGGKGDSGERIRAGKFKSGSTQKTGHTIKKKNIVVDARKSGDALTKKDREKIRRLLKRQGRLVSKY
jgi:hypothetical protein|tara:strand:+ start:82 stop:417 length:336 start_codon:yes stop_codon:yes gene_type:complete